VIVIVTHDGIVATSAARYPSGIDFGCGFQSLRPSDTRSSAGWVTLRVQFDREDEACFVVLGLGPRVDVMEPASLRDRVAADAAAVLARLSEGTPA